MPASAWRGGVPADVVSMSKINHIAPEFRVPSANGNGVVLLVIQNASRETVSIQGAKNETIVLTLDRKDFERGPYEYDGLVRAHQAGGFKINGLVVPFLAPIASEAIP